MVKVTMDRELAYELVDARVDLLNKKIKAVLEHWDYDDVGKFLSDVQYKEIEKAKPFAADVKRYLDKISFLVTLKTSWEELDDDGDFSPDFEYQELDDDDEISLEFDDVDADIDEDISGDYIEIDDYDSERQIFILDEDDEDALWED